MEHHRTSKRMLRNGGLSAWMACIALLLAPRGAEAQNKKAATKHAQAAKSEAPAQFPAGNAANGKNLFLSDGCYECHGTVAQGGPAAPRIGPDPLPLAVIIKYVRHPSGQMPPYTARVISDAQLADIHAFLESLPHPPQPDSIPLLKDLVKK